MTEEHRRGRVGERVRGSNDGGTSERESGREGEGEKDGAKK
jgi:hypothetical protein